MSSIIPIKVTRIKFYVDQLRHAICEIGNEPPPALAKAKSLSDSMDAERIQDADVMFWQFVKAGIEFVIDYMSTDATPDQFNEETLSRAYNDLRSLLNFMLVVHNINWSPELLSPSMD